MLIRIAKHCVALKEYQQNDARLRRVPRLDLVSLSHVENWRPHG